MSVRGSAIPSASCPLTTPSLSSRPSDCSLLSSLVSIRRSTRSPSSSLVFCLCQRLLSCPLALSPLDRFHPSSAPSSTSGAPHFTYAYAQVSPRFLNMTRDLTDDTSTTPFHLPSQHLRSIHSSPQDGYLLRRPCSRHNPAGSGQCEQHQHQRQPRRLSPQASHPRIRARRVRFNGP